MPRRTGFALLVVPVFSLGLLLPSPALAGGGCHAGLTEGEGDTVAMSKACFRPGILRVDPGAQIRFVNKDPLAHNVTANGWGFFEDMEEGDAFRATFGESGIYPFACTYHPGMTGAIVVGDGIGAGSGELVRVYEEASTTARPASSTEGSGLGWLAAGAGGVLLGVGVMLLIRRRGNAAG
jgi:plastocyanin